MLNYPFFVCLCVCLRLSLSSQNDCMTDYYWYFISGKLLNAKS